MASAREAEQRPVFYGDTRVLSDRRKGSCLYWVRHTPPWPAHPFFCLRALVVGALPTSSPRAPISFFLSCLPSCRRWCRTSPPASTSPPFTRISCANAGKWSTSDLRDASRLVRSRRRRRLSSSSSAEAAPCQSVDRTRTRASEYSGPSRETRTQTYNIIANNTHAPDRSRQSARDVRQSRVGTAVECPPRRTSTTSRRQIERHTFTDNASRTRAQEPSTHTNPPPIARAINPPKSIEAPIRNSLPPCTCPPATPRQPLSKSGPYHSSIDRLILGVPAGERRCERGSGAVRARCVRRVGDAS